MKRCITIFILLLHINYFMFLPQSDEQDCYDTSGQQTDDVNSVAELICVTLGFDKTADDEDDDNGNNLTITQSCDLFCQPVFTVSPKKIFADTYSNLFAEYKTSIPNLIFYDIIAPPPKA